MRAVHYSAGRAAGLEFVDPGDRRTCSACSPRACAACARAWLDARRPRASLGTVGALPRAHRGGRREPLGSPARRARARARHHRRRSAPRRRARARSCRPRRVCAAPGKSTVGPLLAERLARAVRRDGRSWIGEAAGLPLDQIFELHGEALLPAPRARDGDRDPRRRPSRRCVAAAGGVVNEPDDVAAAARSNAPRSSGCAPSPRITGAASSRRATAGRWPTTPTAMDELRAILRAREPLYSQARFVVDTARRSVRAVVDEIVRRTANLSPSASMPCSAER